MRHRTVLLTLLTALLMAGCRSRRTTGTYEMDVGGSMLTHMEGAVEASHVGMFVSPRREFLISLTLPDEAPVGRYRVPRLLIIATRHFPETRTYEIARGDPSVMFPTIDSVGQAVFVRDVNVPWHGINGSLDIRRRGWWSNRFAGTFTILFARGADTMTIKGSFRTTGNE